MRNPTRNKGFTLIETIVVAVLLVILGGLTYTGVKGYVVRADQTARDQTARDLFLAAQSAMTHVYANDPEQAATLAAGGRTVVLSQILPQPAGDEWLQELANNAENIVYLSVNGGSDRDTNALLGLISDYVDDKPVLNGNILIEFNRVTGNLLSCFYSESTTLAYGGAYNAYNRGESARSSAKVGYYGVSGTGTRPARELVEEKMEVVPFGDPAVLLVDYDGSQLPGEPTHHNIHSGQNYGLFTVECTLPEGATDDLIYTLDLYRTGSDTPAFSLTMGPDSNAANVALPDLPMDLTAAMTRPSAYTAGGADRSVVLYRMPRGDSLGRTVLVLVLDSVTDGRGIRDMYPELADGDLVASFTAATMDESYTRTVVSEPHNALYASADASGTAFISSIRHLNNVRWHADKAYRQTRDVDAVDYLGNVLDFVPIADATDGTFSGTYHGGDFAIRSLSVAAENAGLFGRVTTHGVSHVNLSLCAISGTSLAGGIAAENAGGTISRCTVTGTVTAGSGGTAGGVAARNTGDIHGCYVGAFISAGVTGGAEGPVAGGIAGVSEGGEIRYCEVGTGACSSTAAGGAEEIETRLVATPYFGARSSLAYSDTDYVPAGYRKNWDLVNDYFEISAWGKSNVAGGIVGSGDGTEISYCVNAASIHAERTNDGTAGGIIGYCGNSASTTPDKLVTLSYNAGSIDAPHYAGGIVGNLHSGVVDNCYNTGYVNASHGDVNGSGAYNGSFKYTATSYALKAFSGGIAGVLSSSTGDSRLTNCYNIQYVGGYDTTHNGIVGFCYQYNMLDNCYFLKNHENSSGSYWVGRVAPVLSGGGVDRVENEKKMHELNNILFGNGYDYDLGVGPFNYPYPYIGVNTDECTLGRSFHRTPWYKTH